MTEQPRPRVGDRVAVTLFARHPPEVRKVQYGTVEKEQDLGARHPLFIRFDHGTGAWYALEAVRLADAE